MMIDPDFFRPVRKLEEAEDLLEACATETSRAARERLTYLLAIWPETPGLMSIPHLHMYAQTVGDSLHILDGGSTERILVYIGNWLYSTGDRGKNWGAVQLVNNRLSESPVQQEFKHFVQPLYAINEDAKASTAHQRIKMAANWRCIEYEALLPQLAYLLKEHTDVANVIMAYSDLYKTLRDVAPLLSSVKTAMREYAPAFPRHSETEVPCYNSIYHLMWLIFRFKTVMSQ
jgi:hypothetical protein